MKSIKANNYRMKGLGGLITMYGGAANTLEEQYEEYKKKFLNLKEEYSNEKDKNERAELRNKMIYYKNLLDETKEKMKSLMKGIEKISKDIF